MNAPGGVYNPAVLLEWILLLVGFVALYFGAEWLVRGASRLAFSMGIRPIVIGLTVVGFGTSMPEMVVSAIASWAGHSETALGNVIGSNIANSGLVLALAAIIAPVASDLRLLRREGPLMVLVTVLVVILGWTGGIDRVEGAGLLLGLLAFLLLSVHWALREPHAVQQSYQEYEAERGLLHPSGTGGQLLLAVVGMAVVIVGAHLLVTSAVEIARGWGMSELVIATTIVAVGTSLPEIATSVVGAWRGEADIAIGNVVGSNLFNLLGVLGLAAVIQPIPIAHHVRSFDMLVMLAFAFLTVLLLRTGHKVTRWEGGLLLAGYVTFVVLLFA